MPVRQRRGSTTTAGSSEAVIASTAGEDTWKTWAGRSHGSESFEFLDLFRGVKRQFNRKFIWGIPPVGTPCPVCYVEPEGKHEWHVTSSCGHAVCIDCLRGYAASLVRDPEHHGPLRCPVCPLPLRPKDAIKAFHNDPELVRAWDAKIRDEVLRALPGFRHCPRCNGSNGNNNNGGGGSGKVHDNTAAAATAAAAATDGEVSSTTTLMGGGFVTPECLAPINKEREQQALKWLNHPFMKQQAFLCMYILYVYFYTTNPSTSIFVDIINTSVVPFWLLRRLWLLARYIAAFEARKRLFAPIVVECPCCDESFILNAESELGNSVIADEATKKWIGSNSRPCPSCSVPICKIDGCNHMQCTHCRARFCWACMRVGSSCRAFNCLNGAPFGNAGDSVDEDQQNNQGGDEQDRGILDRIERISNASTNFDRRDGIVLGSIGFVFMARESPTVQWIAEILVKTFALIFSTGFIPTLLMIFVLSARFITSLRRFLPPHVRDLLDGSAQGRVAEQLYDVDNAVERRLLEETLRRSMIER